MAKERGIIKMVLTNFLNSFRPRQIRGNLMGSDRFGNKYFEIPADPRTGKRKTSRWFEPTVKDKFDQTLQPEWEAWLRYRRQEIPSEEELLKNRAISDMTKANVAKLKAEESDKLPPPSSSQVAAEGKAAFPKYDEFEVSPGVPAPRDKEKEP